MKKIIIIFLLSAFTTANASKTIPIDTFKITKDSLGYGIDTTSKRKTLNERTKLKCVIGNTIKNKSSESKIYKSTAYETTNDNSLIRAKGSANLDFWLSGVKASVEYNMKESKTETNLKDDYSISLSGPSYSIQNTQENQYTNSEIYCADSYIQAISTGMQQKLTASIEFFTKEELEKFTAKVKISIAGGLLKKTFKYEDENKSLLENATIRVSHYYHGGLTQKLLELRDYNINKAITFRCTFSNINDCMDKYIALNNYLTSEEFIDEVTTKNLFDPTSITTYQYNESALRDNQSANGDPINTDNALAFISLTYDLKEQYAELEKLESLKTKSDSTDIRTQIEVKQAEIESTQEKLDFCLTSTEICSE